MHRCTTDMWDKLTCLSQLDTSVCMSLCVCVCVCVSYSMCYKPVHVTNEVKLHVHLRFAHQLQHVLQMKLHVPCVAIIFKILGHTKVKNSWSIWQYMDLNCMSSHCYNISYIIKAKETECTIYSLASWSNVPQECNYGQLLARKARGLP